MIEFADKTKGWTDHALTLVREYITEHAEPSDATCSLFVVWQSFVLDNYKCMIVPSYPCNMCFIVTWDDSNEKWYVDAYRKIDNQEHPL